jgi:hypothetical protein
LLAIGEFPQRVHAGLIQRTPAERLIGHISRDSTAIEVREKAQPKRKVAPQAPPVRRSHHQTKKPKSPEQGRYPRSVQPSLPARAVQCPILRGEGLAASGMEDGWRLDRQTAVQPPGYEEGCAVRMEMRPVSAVVGHGNVVG